MITWTVESAWYEPVSTEGQDEGWRRDERARFVFEASAYDAEIGRIRALHAARSATE